MKSPVPFLGFKAESFASKAKLAVKNKYTYNLLHLIPLPDLHLYLCTYIYIEYILKIQQGEVNKLEFCWNIQKWNNNHILISFSIHTVCLQYTYITYRLTYNMFRKNNLGCNNGYCWKTLY